MTYARFAAVIATSTIVMFGLMYLNVYALDHVFFSQTRMWMALVMGATMAVTMIGFMWQANVRIVIGSAVAARAPDLPPRPAK